MRWVIGLLVLEVALINVTRQAIEFNCMTNWPALCQFGNGLMVSFYIVLGAFVALMIFAPELRRRLFSEAGLHRTGLLLNLAGMAAFFLPLGHLQQGRDAYDLYFVGTTWAIGATLFASGTLLMMAPLRLWGEAIAAFGWRLPLFVLAAAVAPHLAIEAQSLWAFELITDLTFQAVSLLLSFFGYELQTYPAEKIIGAGDFFAEVGRPCSGIEGVALVTIFLTIYLVLFRRDLRFPAALLLYPMAILVSYALNIVRIALLMAIGLEGYPDLAVGGFHSHAGWLMFTLLALGLIVLAQRLALFRAVEAAPVPEMPLLSDPLAAQILPFIVFMASALLVSTVSNDPAALYPLRTVAMIAVLALFVPFLANLDWRLDPLALGAGLGIGVLWLATAERGGMAPEGADSYLVIWILARLVGTALLVPIIEELFFRGYLLNRIAPAESPPWRILLGLLVTTALFAVLHDRWAAAAAAGIVFGLLALRTRNVTDAIVAHAVANGVIGAWALATGDWGLI